MEGRVEGFETHFAVLGTQIGGLQLRIDEVDRRLSARIDALDHKMDRFREALSSRIGELDRRLTARIDRNFQWTMGVNVVLWGTILVALFFRT